MSNKDAATNVNPRINSSWLHMLTEEFASGYFLDLKKFIIEEKKQYKIYPPSKQIFSAFDLTPFEAVKVVILGQDPYHGAGQAHGLCFSVQHGVRIPPSLQNIYKELATDVGFKAPDHGFLESWAQQGVLLLNAVLTVRHGAAGSHQKRGWERFTDAAIQSLSENRSNLVFMLWGNYARAKKSLIQTDRHLVLEAPHPSPFSANNGFFGCKHFSKANEYLQQHGKSPVDWTLA